MAESSAKITTVTFDVGSTLLESSPEIDEMFYLVATERGHELTYEEVSVRLDAVNQFYEEEYLKDGDFWCSPEGSVEIFLEMYRYLAHLVGLGDEADDLAYAINECYHFAESWAIYDDVLPCLKALKAAHIKIGVVSNWSADLKDLLRSLRLLPYFDSVIASAEVGYRKPNPVTFDLALEELQSSPAETIHVGDRVDADGVGAQAAGIRPLIINRNPTTAAPQEFTQITSLEQVLSFIG